MQTLAIYSCILCVILVYGIENDADIIYSILYVLYQSMGYIENYAYISHPLVFFVFPLPNLLFNVLVLFFWFVFSFCRCSFFWFFFLWFVFSFCICAQIWRCMRVSDGLRMSLVILRLFCWVEKHLRPECVPSDARDFLETCFARNPEGRGSALVLLLHRFFCEEDMYSLRRLFASLDG